MHSSHGKGINLSEAKTLGLNVYDLTNDGDLEDIILSIYHASTILFEQTAAQKFIINNVGKTYINNYQHKK